MSIENRQVVDQSWYNPSEDCDFEKRESVQNVIKQERINDELQRLNDLKGKELDSLISEFSCQYDPFAVMKQILVSARSEGYAFNSAVLTKSYESKFEQYKQELAKAIVEGKSNEDE